MTGIACLAMPALVCAAGLSNTMDSQKAQQLWNKQTQGTQQLQQLDQGQSPSAMSELSGKSAPWQNQAKDMEKQLMPNSNSALLMSAGMAAEGRISVDGDTLPSPLPKSRTTPVMRFGTNPGLDNKLVPGRHQFNMYSGGRGTSWSNRAQTKSSCIPGAPCY